MMMKLQLSVLVALAVQPTGNDIMNKEIQSITLLFENCDEATIPQENIKQLYCDGIKEVICKSNNQINIAKECDNLILTISNTDIKTQYGYPLFDRIFEYKDISYVYIKYDDNNEESIRLPWLDDDNNEDENQYQVQSSDKNGCIYISVIKR